MSERESQAEPQKKYRNGLVRRLEQLDEKITDLHDAVVAALTRGRLQPPQQQDLHRERR